MRVVIQNDGDSADVSLQPFTSGRRTVRFVGLAVRVVIQNDGDSVDVSLLKLRIY